LFFFEHAQTAGSCPLQLANSSAHATRQLAPAGTLPPFATVKTAPTDITVRVHSRSLIASGNFAGHELACASEPVEPSHFPLSVPHLHVCFLHLHFGGFPENIDPFSQTTWHAIEERFGLESIFLRTSSEQKTDNPAPKSTVLGSSHSGASSLQDVLGTHSHLFSSPHLQIARRSSFALP